MATIISFGQIQIGRKNLQGPWVVVLVSDEIVFVPRLLDSLEVGQCLLSIKRQPLQINFMQHRLRVAQVTYPTRPQPGPAIDGAILEP